MGAVRISLGLMFLVLMMIPQVAFAHGDHIEQPVHDWLTDVEEAKKQAKAQKKHILIHFTGSDWNPPCKHLWDHIFSKKDFRAAADQRYILLYIDFPRRHMLDEKMAKQNRAMSKAYDVVDFPTIMIMDAEGHELYRSVGVQEELRSADYVDWITEGMTLFQVMKKKVANSEGIEKARAIDALLKSGSHLSEKKRRELMAEIVSLDADGKAGFKSVYELMIKYEMMMDRVRTNEVKDSDGLLALLDSFLKENEVQGEMLQEIMVMRAQVFITRRDLVKAYEAYQIAAEAAPGTYLGKMVRQTLPQMKLAIDAAGLTPSNEKSPQE